VLLLVDVALAAAGSAAALERLAAEDVVQVDKVSRSDSAFASHVDRNKKLVIDRLRGLLRRLALALVSMASAVGVALISDQVALVRLSGAHLGTASAFIFAWAGLSRLSWQQGSYKGDTTIERADTAIFNTLCWLGMYFAALTLS
jgi:hypothetical protein